MQTVSQAKVQLIPLSKIDRAPQVRTTMEKDALAELAEDMRTNGVLQPVLLRPQPKGRYRVIAGHRRIAAATIAELPSVPAMVKDADDASALMMQLSENIHREDLSTADLANAVRQLFDELGSLDAVAAFVMKSRAWVSKHLSLTLPDFSWEARRVLEDGITDDLELIGVVNQVSRLCYNNRQPLDMLVNAIKAGTMDRAGARLYLKELKEQLAQKEEIDAAKAKLAAAKSKKPPRFNAKDTARSIYFDLRHGSTTAAEALAEVTPNEEIQILAYLGPYHTQGQLDADAIRAKLHKGQSASAAAWPLLMNADVLSSAETFAAYTAGVMGVQLIPLVDFYSRMFSHQTDKLVSPAKPEAAPKK